MSPSETPDPDVRVFDGLEALSRAAADALIAKMEAVLDEQERFALALAGGSTPRRLYELLAGPYRDRVPWGRLLLFWGDERYVPPDHAASNYRMACEALLNHVALQPEHLCPIPTDPPTPAIAADQYAATLRQAFSDRDTTFDVVLLGLGDDGHTASLFPENAPHEAFEQANVPWVEAVTAPERYDVRERITLTLPALNGARRVFFLVAGAEKRAALRAVLAAADPALPASHVQAREGVTWFVDEAAFGA